MSSKYLGIVDPKQVTRGGSHTFRASDIYEEYQMIKALPGVGDHARLFLSTDYGKRFTVAGQPLWVTLVVSDSFTGKADVNVWCAALFPALTGNDLENVCVPRQLNAPS